MLVDEFSSLKRAGIDIAKAQEYQVLCLPENIDAKAANEGLHDTQDSICVAKALKEGGLRCANSYDLGMKAKVLERRGGDLWLGVIWILEKMAVPVFVGVLSSLITSRINRKRQAECSDDPLSLQSRIHVTLKIRTDREFSSITYDGDPDTLHKVLQALPDHEPTEEPNG